VSFQFRKSPRQAPGLDQVRGLFGEMLREDPAAPRNQRHTAGRVFERLCDGHGAAVLAPVGAERIHYEPR